MIRQRNLVHCFPIERQWPNPATNKCACFDCAAQSNHANVIAVIDLELSSLAPAKSQRTSPAAIPRDDSENATCHRPCGVPSSGRSLERKEIVGHPAERSDSPGAQTIAQRDWCRENKAHSRPATRAARNELGTGRPSNLWARKSNPSRPRAE